MDKRIEEELRELEELSGDFLKISDFLDEKIKTIKDRLDELEDEK